MKLGVIDVGTNSCRMLIVEGKGIGEGLEELRREQIITRLGEGVDQSGRLTQEAVKRTMKAIKLFYREMRENFQVQALKIVGTSALRDVKNADLLIEQVIMETGQKLQIISGEEEASYVFQGVSLQMEPGNHLIIDIGGGSTEFIWSQNDRLNYRSLNMGAVRLTERVIQDPQAPITGQDLLIIKEVVQKLLKQDLRFDDNQDKTEINNLIGVGGTITTLAAIELKMENYQREFIEGYSLGLEDINDIINELVGLTASERRGIPGLQSGREDIIVAGALILVEIMEELGFRAIRVSEHDILYGLVRELLEINST